MIARRTKRSSTTFAGEASRDSPFFVPFTHPNRISNSLQLSLRLKIIFEQACPSTQLWRTTAIRLSAYVSSTSLCRTFRTQSSKTRACSTKQEQTNLFLTFDCGWRTSKEARVHRLLTDTATSWSSMKKVCKLLRLLLMRLLPTSGQQIPRLLFR